MTVYLSNIALIFLWALLLLLIRPNHTKKAVYCGLVCLQWVLISGLRHVTVGPDTPGYRRQFYQIASESWSARFEMFKTVYIDGEGKDAGYSLLVKIFQIFSTNYQVFLLFVALLFMVSMSVWIYQNSSMPCMSFLIYSVLFYSFFSITGIRQTIATALVIFVGYRFVKERKLLPFLVIALIAFTIHKSSIIFIPYYFIANINITPRYVSVVAVIAAAIVSFGKQIYEPVAEFLGFGEGMIENDYGGAETFTFLMLSVCVVSFVLYPWIHKNRTDAKFLYNAIFLTTVTTLLVYQNQSFMRIQQYYSLFIMLMIPEIIKVFGKKNAVTILIYFVLTASMLLLFVRNHPYYLFFWQ